LTLVETLRRDGIALLPTGLRVDHAAELAAHLRASPCYPGHVKVYGDRVPRTFEEIRETHDLWCHDMRDVVLAPHFWDFVISLMPTAVEYLGSAPHLYSLNAFWAKPGGSIWKDLQTFHRDADDDRFLTLFVYGTDVLDVNDGPHLFRAGTHARPDLAPEDCFEQEFAPVSVYGRAGTAFLADTRGLHMGMKPTHGERLLLWARWGVSERPASYDWDQLEPVPVGDRYSIDPVTRELVKLVVV